MGFSFTADFSGITPAGLGAPRDAGVYRVRITSAEETKTQKSGKPRIALQCAVLDDGYVGSQIFDGLMIPTNPAEAKKYGPWVLACLTSIGKPLDRLQKKVKITEKSFIGQEGYMKFTPANGPGTYAQKAWISADAYEMLLPYRGQAAASGGEDEDEDLELEDSDEMEVEEDSDTDTSDAGVDTDDDLDDLIA